MNLNNLGYLLSTMPAAATGGSATGAAPAQSVADSLTGSQTAGGSSPFGLLLAQQFAAAGGTTTPGGAALPAQLAALFGQSTATGGTAPATAGQAGSGGNAAGDGTLASTLLGELLSLMQALLTAEAAAGNGASTQSGTGQTAGNGLDDAAGTTPGATGSVPQAAADAAAGQTGAAGSVGSTVSPEMQQVLSQLTTLWPQLLAFLQQSLAAQGVQLTGATPAQTGGNSATLPGSLVLPTTGSTDVSQLAAQAGSLALPIDTPASLRWLLNGGLATAGSTAGQGTAGQGATASTPAQSGQLTLPDGSTLTLSLTQLGDGRFSATLDNAQGQTLLTAQLTVQRLPVADPSAATLPLAGNQPASAAQPLTQPVGLPATYFSSSGTTVASTGVNPAVQLSGAAVQPSNAASSGSPALAAGSAGAASVLPGATTVAAGRTAQAAGTAPAFSLPELSRSAAVPVSNKAVTPTVASDSLSQAATPVQDRLTAVLASATPARTVAVPVSTQRQAAMPAPPSQPTTTSGSDNAQANPAAATLPNVTKNTANSPAAVTEPTRTADKAGVDAVRSVADGTALAAATVDSGTAAETMPLSLALTPSTLNPHLLQFSTPDVPTANTALLDYTELSQRVLGQTQSAQAQGDGLYQAKLELNPPGLGRLYASIAVHDGQVAVQLAVASPAPRKQLVASLAGLKRSLEERLAQGAKHAAADLSG